MFTFTFRGRICRYPKSIVLLLSYHFLLNLITKDLSHFNPANLIAELWGTFYSFSFVILWYHSLWVGDLDRIRVVRYNTSVHGIKNEVDEFHRKNKNNGDEAITARKRFDKVDHKFFKYNLKRVKELSLSHNPFKPLRTIGSLSYIRI